MANLLRYKDIEKAQRVLLYGAPKAGKTTMAGELASKYRLLWLDLEDGVDTLFGSLNDTQLENVEYIRIPDSPSNPVAVDTLLKMFDSKIAGYICEDHGNWNCIQCAKKKDEFFQIDLNKLTPEEGWIIVIDSGTQYGQSAYHNVCNNSNISLTDGDKASFMIWGVQGAAIEKLFGLIQAGNNHVLLTAHEMEVEYPDKSKKLVASMGTKKVASSFGKYFNHIIRCSRQSMAHKQVSTTTAQVNVESGSRWGLDITEDGITILDFFKLPEHKQGKSLTTPKLGAATGDSMAKLKAKLAKK